MAPVKQTAGAAGMDLYVTEYMRISPTTTTEQAYKVPTGLAMEIPEGYHGKVFLRSGTGLKTKLRLANGTGIIDSDYRGEIMLLIENVGPFHYFIQEGERLAQIIIEKNVDFTVEEVEELSETARGEGGMGSTGK